MFLTLYLSILLLLWLTTTIVLLINARSIGFLDRQPLATETPSLAIIIAVRNEEENLEAALKSVTALHYHNHQVVIVNDRSTDGTANIIAQMQWTNTNISTVEITTLPELWLGKNHALYQGYLQSDAEWLLFTDADIVFDKDAVSKAMGYALANELDHLTIFPDIQSRSWLLNSVLPTFGIMLDLKLRPWAAKNRKSMASIGVGAFNLVRRTAYEAIGTHESIKMRPDDDLQLGSKIKHAGYHQNVLNGQDNISLEWYPSVKEFIAGLMKNTFSTFNYQPVKAIGAGFATLFVFALPVPLALLFGSNIDIALALGMLLTLCILFPCRFARSPWWHGLMLPVAGFIMAWVVFKSTFLTLYQQGVYWRGHFYKLGDLRRG